MSAIDIAAGYRRVMAKFPRIMDRLRAMGSSEAEEWRPVPRYEGRYEVSSLGRIRSLARVETTAKGQKRPVAGGILRPMLDKDGYLQVAFRTNGKMEMRRLHRLVALAFLGPPNPLHKEVAHLDGDRTNAHLGNLKWVSRTENVSHKRIHGTLQYGERHPRAKLTDEQAAEIRSLRGKARYRDLAARYGVSVYTIQDVIYGKTYRRPQPDAPNPTPDNHPTCLDEGEG